MTTEAKKRVAKQENRKRAVFIFKLLLLAGLCYVSIQYQEWIKAQPVRMFDLIRSLIFYLSANILISLARIVFVYLYIRRKQLVKENNVVLAINRMATLLNAAILVASIILLSNLTWEAFFTSFSLVAVATVLLTKDYISNTVNGLILMVSDRIVLNDYIKIGSHTGKVVDITLSNVHLLNDAKHVILIPNNTVFASDVINYTRKASRYVEVDFEVKPDMIKDLTELEEQLIEAMRPYDSLVKKNSYELLVDHVASDEISLRFRFVLQASDMQKEKKLKHEILRKVTQIFYNKSYQV